MFENLAPQQTWAPKITCTNAEESDIARCTQEPKSQDPFVDEPLQSIVKRAGVQELRSTSMRESAPT